MLIEPIKNKKGKVKTNVEICREVYSILKDLRDGTPDMSATEKDEANMKFYSICGGDSDNADKVMSWLEQITKIEDEDEAQRMIAKTIIPIPGIKKQPTIRR